MEIKIENESFRFCRSKYLIKTAWIDFLHDVETPSDFLLDNNFWQKNDLTEIACTHIRYTYLFKRNGKKRCVLHKHSMRLSSHSFRYSKILFCGGVASVCCVVYDCMVFVWYEKIYICTIFFCSPSWLDVEIPIKLKQTHTRPIPQHSNMNHKQMADKFKCKFSITLLCVFKHFTPHELFLWVYNPAYAKRRSETENIWR